MRWIIDRLGIRLRVPRINVPRIIAAILLALVLAGLYFWDWLKSQPDSRFEVWPFTDSDRMVEPDLQLSDELQVEPEAVPAGHHCADPYHEGDCAEPEGRWLGPDVFVPFPPIPVVLDDRVPPGAVLVVHTDTLAKDARLGPPGSCSVAGLGATGPGNGTWPPPQPE